MKKLIQTFLICVLLVSLSACVPQKEPEALSTTSAAAPASTAPAAQTAPSEPEAKQEEAPPAELSYWIAVSEPNMMTTNQEISGFQYLQEVTNIKLNFIHPPTGQTTEQFNLMIVSNDLPDMINYNWGTYPGGVEAAVQGNILIALNDLIDSSMPNYKAYLTRFPEVDMMAKTDSGLHCVFPGMYTTTPEDSAGHQSISGRIPAYETYLGMYVRQDWLEQLNMEIPVTLDDWTDMLSAFRDELGASAPLSITTGFIKDSAVFLSAFDLCAGLYEDGKTVKYGPYEPAYREYLAFMNNLYANKLLDNDFAILDNPAFTAKVLTDQTGAWSGYTSTHCGVLHDQIHAENPEATFYPIGVKNPVKEAGQQLKYRQASYPVLFSVATGVTTSCEDTSAVARFVDWGFTDEGDAALNWGDPSAPAAEIVDGWPRWVDAVANNPDYTPTQMYRLYCAYNGPFPIDHWTRLLSKGSYTTPESINALVTWETQNGLYPSTLPPVSLKPEETSEYANLYTEINTYASEMYTKFIMGVESLDQFDNYIATLEKMGIERVLTMQQEALIRYYER